MNRLYKKLNHPGTVAYVLIMPSLLIITLFLLLPLLASLILSTMKLDIFLQKISFTGVENYIRMFRDERFWNALWNTLHFTSLVIPMQMTLSLLLAVYLSKPTRFKQIIRTTLFIPVVCSLTAMGIVWSLLLDPSIGIYTRFLKSIGFSQVELLKNSLTAMPTVALMTVWKNFGLTMVILMAGIQTIPISFYEAAEIDGAGKWNILKSITIPSILPSLGFCIITTMIDCLKVFDQIFVMTQGGPLYSTETLVQYIYTRGFKIAPFNLGYASSIAVVLLVLIAGATSVTFKNIMNQDNT